MKSNENMKIHKHDKKTKHNENTLENIVLK